MSVSDTRTLPRSLYVCVCVCVCVCVYRCDAPSSKGEIIYCRVLYHALRINHEQTTQRDSFCRVENIECLRYLSLEIGHKRILESTESSLRSRFFDPCQVRVFAVHTESEHFGIERLKLVISLRALSSIFTHICTHRGRERACSFNVSKFLFLDTISHSLSLYKYIYIYVCVCVCVCIDSTHRSENATISVGHTKVKSSG